ncbi:phytoene desaturase family protein [Pseudalkalibacillus caeni]|uniref:Phytoene desaturase n=1 Tax=Exobacillus caeni TaxID=2574798 RepID=A0A5R9F3B1_9BACL|nr:phytoene desaturase family protein [Pseudalkalibacillus caeni]TLS36068.1 phytoene desaturase [Pseudalkalibacillus caeni]
MKKVIIVGAGPGGLSAGMILASQGMKVKVFEKQPFVGGRTSEMEVGEYRFDRGPTFLNMPHILEEAFEAAGRNLHDYVTLKEIDPMYELRFDALSFSPSRDQQKTREQIREKFPEDVAGYDRFMKQEAKKLDALLPILRNKHDSPTDYFRWRFLKALPKLSVHDSLYGRLSSYFKDERLRLSFTFQSKYLGMSPWECPGAFTILSYMEHAYGVHHPIGGVNQVTKAMATVIEEHGGEVITNAGVKKITTENGKAVGVLLENGEKESADEVIVNADFPYAASELLEPGLSKKHTPEKLAKKKYSCSAFMMYLGINRQYDLPHHTIVFSSDYKKNVEEITGTKTLSEDPSIYIHNPAVTDPTLAPPGKSSVYLLAPVPNNFSEIEWEEKKQDFRSLILKQLEKRTGFSNIENHIEEEVIFTPYNWEQDLNIYKGATFSMAHNLPQMMYFRPHNKMKEVDRLWLVGGGTHPGSGLPTIIESARITSAMLIQKHAGEGLKV